MKNKDGDMVWHYLELQDWARRGWNSTTRWDKRFGKQVHRDNRPVLLDVDSIIKSSDFKSILGLINDNDE